MLINLPPATMINRIVPKDRFKFKDATQITRIRWLAKLATTTLNLDSRDITEIEVFSIEMKQFDIDILLKIQAKIPHPILFLVNDNWVGMQFDGDMYSQERTEPFLIDGLSIEEVRDNFIRQILLITDITKSLKQQVDEIRIINELKFEIDRINNQIKRAIQTNKQQALARERYTLEQKLVKIKGE